MKRKPHAAGIEGAELDKLVDKEKPLFLSGSPPCDASSSLQNITAATRDPVEAQEKTAVGTRRLRTAVHFYKKQHRAGRVFLHEHPNNAKSWEDEEVKDL